MEKMLWKDRKVRDDEFLEQPRRLVYHFHVFLPQAYTAVRNRIGRLLVVDWIGFGPPSYGSNYRHDFILGYKYGSLYSDVGMGPRR